MSGLQGDQAAQAERIIAGWRRQGRDDALSGNVMKTPGWSNELGWALRDAYLEGYESVRLADAT